MTAGAAWGLRPAPALWTLRLPEAEAVNDPLAAAFLRHRDDPDTRHTHYHEGRHENIVIDLAKLPEAGPVLARAREAAAAILGRAPEALRLAAWFNAMEPGHVTLSHRHDIRGELLSAVYYVAVPEHSGDLVVLDPPLTTVVRPAPGLLVLFPPETLHEVTRHEGEGLRLSLAMNFGPAEG